MPVLPSEATGVTSAVPGGEAGPVVPVTGCVSHSRLAMYRLVPSEYAVSPSATMVTGSPLPRLEPLRSNVSTVSIELPVYDAAAGWLTSAQFTSPVRVIAPVVTSYRGSHWLSLARVIAVG